MLVAGRDSIPVEECRRHELAVVVAARIDGHARLSNQLDFKADLLAHLAMCGRIGILVELHVTADAQPDAELVVASQQDPRTVHAEDLHGEIDVFMDMRHQPHLLSVALLDGAAR
jgi:hypothetical protein